MVILWEEGEHTQTHEETSVAIWENPSEGFIKINCYAALSKQGSVAGIVAVARDHTGRILDGLGVRRRSGSILASETEAIR